MLAGCFPSMGVMHEVGTYFKILNALKDCQNACCKCGSDAGNTCLTLPTECSPMDADRIVLSQGVDVNSKVVQVVMC